MKRNFEVWLHFCFAKLPATVHSEECFTLSTPAQLTSYATGSHSTMRSSARESQGQQQLMPQTMGFMSQMELGHHPYSVGERCKPQDRWPQARALAKAASRTPRVPAPDPGARRHDVCPTKLRHVSCVRGSARSVAHYLPSLPHDR